MVPAALDMEKRAPDRRPNVPDPALTDTGGPRKTGLFRLFGPLGKRVERWLSGPAHSDPLYLSNRTVGQKARAWIIIGFVACAFAAFVYLGSTGFFGAQTAPAPAELTPAEEAARTLPNVAKVRIDGKVEVEATDAHIVHGREVTLEGTARNATSRTIPGAELTFDIADKAGSQLAAVVVKVGTLPPMASTRFRVTVPDRNAAYAIVREVHTR
jgi:hypothetical protein